VIIPIIIPDAFSDVRSVTYVGVIVPGRGTDHAIAFSAYPPCVIRRAVRRATTWRPSDDLNLVACTGLCFVSVPPLPRQGSKFEGND
jgi:hypothetical protein